MSTKPVELTNIEQALEEAQGISDPITKQLVESAIAIILKRFSEGVQEEELKSDFDLNFFVNMMKELFSDHKFLKEILAGKDMSWFGESEIDESEPNKLVTIIFPNTPSKIIGATPHRTGPSIFYKKDDLLKQPDSSSELDQIEIKMRLSKIEERLNELEGKKN